MPPTVPARFRRVVRALRERVAGVRAREPVRLARRAGARVQPGGMAAPGARLRAAGDRHRGAHRSRGRARPVRTRRRAGRPPQLRVRRAGHGRARVRADLPAHAPASRRIDGHGGDRPSDWSTPESPVAFTAVVRGIAGRRGDPAPRGAVLFTVDGERSGNPVPLDSAGRATWRAPRLPGGTHRVTASYVPAQGSTTSPAAATNGSTWCGARTSAE